MSFSEHFFTLSRFNDHHSPAHKNGHPNLNLKERCRELLDKADVHINGSRPWDMQIGNKRFYTRIFSEGSLGLRESYMDG